MNYAIVVVDLVKGNVDLNQNLGIHQQAKNIIPNIQSLLKKARLKNWKVIYACDSFMPEDFFFKSKLRPHALRGTEGVKVIDPLHPMNGDIVFEKRSMSSFFHTDLDITLRNLNIDFIGIVGISTPYCVLMTALDAISNNISAAIIEDCCAAHKHEIHKTTCEIYKKSHLFPLLRVISSEEFLSY